MRRLLIVALAAATGCGGEPPAERTSPSLRARENDIARQRQILLRQAEAHGGWEAWHESAQPFRDALEARLAKPDILNNKLLFGDDGFIFTGVRAEYLLQTDLIHFRSHPEDPPKMTSRVIRAVETLKSQLNAQGVDLLFVPAPLRIEVYPERLPSPAAPGRSVNPQRAALMIELLDRGVEVVDLLPALLDARHLDQQEGDLLALPDNAHWSSRGARIAAEVIAERIARYSFVGKPGSIEYEVEVRSTPGYTSWPLILDPELRGAHQSRKWRIERVLHPDGTPYSDVEDAAVLVAGDSFSGYFSDLSAGLSAHLARAIGQPVSLYSQPGNGPKLPRTLMRKGPDYLAGRRVLVWVFSSDELDPDRGQLWNILPEGALTGKRR